jgi:hypothetical protein
MLVLLLLACTAPRIDAPPADDRQAIERLLLELYAAVSFGPRGGPDWEKFGTLVRADAIFIQAERGETETRHMSLEEFREDWRSFMTSTSVGERGFRETLIRHQTAVFGNVAHSFVVFEPRVGSGDDRPLTLGVDSIQLVKDRGRWWIVSITTQFETRELKVPERFSQ